jgi:isoleucyl-tRNA synthetase
MNVLYADPVPQVELSKGRPNYTFYDGPPFATGLPHYGHLLASTIKDIIPRYWSMKGYHVERRFGWDTHGLPIEHEIDKKLGVTGRAAVMEMGLEKYNAECRAIVMRFREEWRHTIERLGRWIDFDNDYKVGFSASQRRHLSRQNANGGRPWIPRSWNPSGGCSSSSSTKARSIKDTA